VHPFYPPIPLAGSVLPKLRLAGGGLLVRGERGEAHTYTDALQTCIVENKTLPRGQSRPGKLPDNENLRAISPGLFKGQDPFVNVGLQLPEKKCQFFLSMFFNFSPKLLA
jgi:hypothetical protein